MCSSFTIVSSKGVLRNLQIRDFIAAQLQAQGIVFHFGESPTAVEKNNDGTFSLVTDSGKEVSDLVMFATGRAPNTKVLV